MKVKAKQFSLFCKKLSSYILETGRKGMASRKGKKSVFWLSCNEFLSLRSRLHWYWFVLPYSQYDVVDSLLVLVSPCIHSLTLQSTINSQTTRGAKEFYLFGSKSMWTLVAMPSLSLQMSNAHQQCWTCPRFKNSRICGLRWLIYSAMLILLTQVKEPNF